MHDPFDRSVDVDTPHAKVRVFEAGSGPPVVLLHGNPDTHDVWAAVVERLAKTHRCIAPDLPGYGASSPQHDVSLAAQAGVVRAIFDALSLQSAHLVVHDVGGTYGLSFVAEARERVAALTICNTSYFSDYRWHFWARVWRTPLLGELVMRLGNEALYVRETTRAAPKLPIELVRHGWRRYHPAARKQVLRWYRYMDPARHVGWEARMIDAVTSLRSQVLWGDRDPFIPSSTADRFGAGTVRHHDDESHWPMAEEPALVADAIRAL
jgi:pimeloyl-ACP methyl ester carboxylesterase